MPLPIKQYKHMFKDVKFLATTAQPSYREVSHWIDLLEDPTGGTIKVWNGAEWKKISGEGDGDTGLVIGDTTGTAFDGARGINLINGCVSRLNKFASVSVRAFIRIKPDGTITSRTTTS